MTNSQNSEIPEPLFATEVDFAIHDIAQNLKFNLEWLPYAYGRAFRHFQGDKFYPEVYKGFENYLQARPDNDKKGQCYFVVGKEQIMNFEQTTRHFLKYEIGIVVMVNLKEIEPTSLETELITQNLISEARNVLNHKLVGKPYRINLKSVEREFRDIFREFSFSEKENYLKAPLQAFRINGEIQLEENCQKVFDRCNAISQNIGKEEYRCFMPSIDFSDDEVFSYLTNTQKLSLGEKLNSFNGFEVVEQLSENLVADSGEFTSFGDWEVENNVFTLKAENEQSTILLGEILEDGKRYRVKIKQNYVIFSSFSLLYTNRGRVRTIATNDLVFDFISAGSILELRGVIKDSNDLIVSDFSVQEVTYISKGI